MTPHPDDPLDQRVDQILVNYELPLALNELTAIDIQLRKDGTGPSARENILYRLIQKDFQERGKEHDLRKLRENFDQLRLGDVKQAPPELILAEFQYRQKIGLSRIGQTDYEDFDHYPAFLELLKTIPPSTESRETNSSEKVEQAVGSTITVKTIASTTAVNPNQDLPPQKPTKPNWISGRIALAVIGFTLLAIHPSPEDRPEGMTWVQVVSNKPVPVIKPEFTKNNLSIPPLREPLQGVNKPVIPAQPQLPIHVFRGHDGKVIFVTFTPNGSRLVSASNSHYDEIKYDERIKQNAIFNMWGNDNSVRIWNVQTGKQVRYLNVNGKSAEEGSRYGPQGLCVSADGKYVAVSSSWEWGKSYADPTVQVWDITTGERMYHIKVPGYHAMRAVMFSEDGTQLFATQSGSKLFTWSLTNRKSVDLEVGNRQCNPNVMPPAMAYTPDGKHIANARYEPGGWGVGIWSRTTGSLELHLEGSKRLTTAISISKDGKRLLAAAEDFSLRLWDLESGKEFLAITDLDNVIRSTALSAKAKWFVTGGDDGIVRVWDVDTKKECTRFTGHSGPVRCLAISPDERLVASGGEDKTIHLWQLP